MEKGKQKAKEKRDSSGYYKVVNCLKDGEAPKPFEIRNLQPEMTDFEIANDVARFFNLITADYIPLPKRSANPSTDVPSFACFEVAQRLKSFKKPKSMIAGDIFPDLITKYSDIIAIPMSDVVNCSLSSHSWPKYWKEETMIIIPKCKNPTSYAELRNLSCTPLLSKILESFVLQRLKKEIKEDLSQYGSTKGCGTEHYLMQSWNHILESLDDGVSAANLISIDFSKAFSSLDHAKCLDMFKRRGASEHSIQMLHAFLEDRRMSVKIGDTMSTPLPINGGSPQGTLLGNLIFIVATSEIDKDISYSNTTEETVPQPTEVSVGLDEPNPQGPINSSSQTEEMDLSSPESLRFFKYSKLNRIADSSRDSDTNSVFEHELIKNDTIPNTWEAGTPLVVKYVDDVLGSEQIFAQAGKLHSTTEKQVCTVFAKRSEELIEAITDNAAELGLKVNAKKTQMVCVSSSASSDVSTYIRETGSANKIRSTKAMKILGFHFSEKPNVSEHVNVMERKIKQRLWLLRNLRNARASRKDLLDSYCCFFATSFGLLFKCIQ